MSKKNKCNGLDCEMCGNAKCPNEEKEKIIDGIDVSESVLTATNNDVYYSQNAVDELQNAIKRLQQENEKIKNQYNCYACGNCNGKEDYINLEKHHKGLRKQFDELVKRNNTLSLRIEELEKENEKLEKKNKELLNLFIKKKHEET